MKSRYTLALALLFSSIPVILTADHHNRSLDLGDVEAAVIWLASEKLPDWNVPFNLKETIQREVIIDRADAHLAQGALSLDVELPSAGTLSVINNDETLHVLYTVIKDVIAHHKTSDIVSDASKTYAREKLATIALWLVAQTNVEGLLPDSITNGRIYQFFRHELARYGVADLIQRACNK